MDKLLGRDLRLAAARKTVTVDIPELECSAILRELSLAQLDTIENNTVKQLAMMIVDENGDRVYTSDEDLANLSEISASVSTRLLIAAAKLNGISQSAVDESVKNLLAGPSTDSASV